MKTSPTRSRSTRKPSGRSRSSRTIEQSKPEITRSPGLYRRVARMIATFSGASTRPRSSIAIPRSASGSNPTPKSAPSATTAFAEEASEVSVGRGPRPGNVPSISPYRTIGSHPASRKTRPISPADPLPMSSTTRSGRSIVTRSATNAPYRSIASSAERPIELSLPRGERPAPVVLHDRALLIEETVPVPGAEADAVVLRRVVRRGDVGRPGEPVLPGHEADHGDREDTVLLDAGAGREDALEERGLEGRAARPCVAADGRRPPGDRGAVGPADRGRLGLRELAPVDAAHVVRLEDRHRTGFTGMVFECSPTAAAAAPPAF